MYALDIAQTISCHRFGRMKQKKGWGRLGFNENTTNLLVFVIDGRAEFWVADSRFSLEAGHILLVPARTPYKAYTEDFCEYFFFRITGVLEPCPEPVYLPVAPREFSFDLPKPEQKKAYIPGYVVDSERFGRIYGCILSCTEYSARTTHAARALLDAEFLKILLILGEITEQQSGNTPTPAALSKMLIYIKKNLTRPITLAQLCMECGLSESYAERLFKKYFGITATEYIHNEKLYYACELMRNTSLNVSSVAHYLGYTDVFYFSRRFKRKFGVSPTKMFPARERQV